MIDPARDALTRFAARADERLEAHFERWRREVPTSERSPTPGHLFGAVRDLTLRGGKRLRPALAWYAAGCVDHGLDESALLDACLSLELLQSALLIHDDIMDRDAERRGGPAVHRMMTRAAGDPHVGDSLAILGGSLALALAQRLITQSKLPPAAVAAGCDELALMQTEVIYGQHLDLIGGVPPSLVQDLKTASYTTRGPVRLGARLAEASGRQIAALEAYATPLGRAFQTRDDLLGTFGDPQRLGKPVGADLRAGRQTELVVLAMSRGGANQRACIERVLSHPDAAPDAIAEACAAIEATGARRALQELVREQTKLAIRGLEGADLLARGCEPLASIASLLVDRVS